MLRRPEFGGGKQFEDAVHELLVCGSEWSFAGRPDRTHDAVHSGRRIEAGLGGSVGIMVTVRMLAISSGVRVCEPAAEVGYTHENE